MGLPIRGKALVVGHTKPGLIFIDRTVAAESYCPVAPCLAFSATHATYDN